MARKSNNAAKVQPVTAHPLFRPVVTLWCGALLGLGSVAVHPAVLDGLLRQSRIEQMLAAALPPVDLAGQTLLALILAATGCVIGLGIGRAATRIAEGRQHKQASKEDVLVLRDELNTPFVAKAEPEEPAPVVETVATEPAPAATVLLPEEPAPAPAERAERHPLPWAAQPAYDRAKTERALRDALTNLQQLRGAA